MRKILLLLLLLLITPLAFTQQFYRSNSLGMELAEIQRFRIDEFEYFLEKIIDGNNTRKILYREFVPIKETERHYADNGNLEREIIIENNIRTERIYRGLLLYRERITNIIDQTGHVRVFRYDSRHLLQSIDDFSLNDKLLSSIIYERDVRGRIASVINSIHSEDLGPQEDMISKFRFDERNLLDAWHGNHDQTGTFIYYRGGRISEIVRTYKGEVVSEHRRAYNHDLSKRTEEILHEADKRIVRNITSEGYILEEITYIGENIVSRINRYYDDDLLILKIRVTPSGVERYIFEYVDGELSSERMYRDGRIYMETVFLEDDVHYEDFFNDGVRVMRIYYKDNERTAIERW